MSRLSHFVLAPIAGAAFMSLACFCGGGCANPYNPYAARPTQKYQTQQNVFLSARTSSAAKPGAQGQAAPAANAQRNQSAPAGVGRVEVSEEYLRQVAAIKAQNEAEARKANDEAARLAAENEVRRDAEIYEFLRLNSRDYPGVWEYRASLKAHVADFDEQIQSLVEAFKNGGRNPDTDASYKALVAQRDMDAATLKTLDSGITDAILARKTMDAANKTKLETASRQQLDTALQNMELSTRRDREKTLEYLNGD